MKKYFSVYVKTDCPYCKRAVSFLEENNSPFIVIVIDKNLEFLEQIKQQTNHKTVPIVLRHDENGTMLIGGSDDLQNYLNSPEFKND
jgi:glutaredoxin